MSAPPIECPDCGCNGCDSRGGDVWECQHCGREFQVIAFAPSPSAVSVTPDSAKCVAFFVLACPNCGSRNVSTSKVIPPLRRHKCRDCRHAFKSVEKVFSS